MDYDNGSFSKSYVAKKSGLLQLSIPITNKYENKSQIIRTDVLISADPIVATTSLLRLKVGRYEYVTINGGAPGYQIKK